MTKAQEVWIGIDLGTQSAKVVAATSTGEVVAQSSLPLTSRRDGAIHEQDPEQWWSAVQHCIAQVVTSLGSRWSVAALATCATSGTVVVCDRDSGQVLSPALMYDDTRAAHFAPEAQQAGSPVWNRLGYSIQGSWALPAMMWLVREGLAQPGSVILTQADYVNRKLSGVALPSDSSHTLKSGFDLDSMTWPTKVFEALSLPREYLNDVVAPGHIIGTVGRQSSTSTGLRAGTPIVSGMTDGSAAQIASGAVSPGQWNSVLGTTLVLKGSSPLRHHDNTGSVYCHRAPCDAGWWPGGASNTGAIAVRDVLPGADHESLVVTNQSIASASVSYPLMGVGERFPFVHPTATGFILTDPSLLTQSDDLSVFSRIALGVTLVERLCFDVISLAGYLVDGPISLTGGGSENRQWNGLRSTVLRRDVLVPRSTESAVGMAILARAGVENCGPEGFSSLVESMVSVDYTLQPEASLRSTVEGKYRTLVTALADRGWIGSELADYARDRE
jgi:sugar (pentulose or hexulose) kinase